MKYITPKLIFIYLIKLDLIEGIIILIIKKNDKKENEEKININLFSLNVKVVSKKDPITNYLNKKKINFDDLRDQIETKRK